MNTTENGRRVALWGLFVDLGDVLALMLFTVLVNMEDYKEAASF